MEADYSVVGVGALAVVVVLLVFAWGPVFKQAGYSPWLCLLMAVPLILLLAWRPVSKQGEYSPWLLVMAVPVVNLLALFWLASSRWPVYKELSELRIAVGKGSATDAQEVMSDAIILEAQGCRDEAIRKLQLVIAHFSETPVGNEASYNLEAIQGLGTDSSV